MTILSKTTAGLSLFSCVKDMHKTAVMNSRKKAAKYESDALISCSIGSQKTNYISTKDAKGKNWFLADENFSKDIKRTIGAITGYISGFLQSGLRYIPNFTACGFAMFLKNAKHANISAAVVGITELWNFIKNSTNIFEKTDYLK